MKKDKSKPAFRTPVGLKTHKVHDVASLSALRKSFDLPAVPMQKREQELRTLINEPETAPPETPLSAEEKALVAARGWAQKVIASDEKIRQTLGAMIAFRRCYAVAYRELQENIEKYSELYPPVPEMGEDYLVQAGMHQAAQPFSEHDLMQGFLDTVLPWIADVVDRHSDVDEEEEKKADELDEKERKDRPIPLGFLLDLDSTEPEIRKDKSIILVGWSNAVRFVLDQIMSTVLAAREGQTFCVVRFYEKRPEGKDENRLLIRLAPNLWEGCSNKTLGVPKVMGEHALPRLTQPVDLLICDHLPRAFTGGFMGRPEGANAGDAHKAMRKWCNLVGAALVGGVLTRGKEITDLRKPEYEQLRTFSLLRAVRVIETEEKGKLRVNIVGSLHNWDVDEEVLEGYGSSTLILPG